MWSGNNPASPAIDMETTYRNGTPSTSMVRLPFFGSVTVKCSTFDVNPIAYPEAVVRERRAVAGRRLTYGFKEPLHSLTALLIYGRKTFISSVFEPRTELS
jgi:hypothetical protein